MLCSPMENLNKLAVTSCSGKCVLYLRYTRFTKGLQSRSATASLLIKSNELVGNNIAFFMYLRNAIVRSASKLTPLPPTPPPCSVHRVHVALNIKKFVLLPLHSHFLCSPLFHPAARIVRIFEAIHFKIYVLRLLHSLYFTPYSFSLQRIVRMFEAVHVKEFVLMLPHSRFLYPFVPYSP